MSKTHVPLDQVRDNPHQPRVEIGDIEGLAETILQHGLRQLPEARLVVDGDQPSYSAYTYAKDGEWYLEEDEMALAELASGHRRVEAIRQLNLDDTVTDGDLRDVGLTPGYVPVDLQRLSGEEVLDLLTIENAQRESLSPIEEARLIGEMVDAGRDAAQIAERFGKSPSWVSNRKRLTTLPVYVQEHVHDEKISVRQAQPLATAFAVEEEHPDLVQQVNVGLKPGTMAGKAMRGHLTSDDIRDRTDELIDVVERMEDSRSSSPQDLPCAFCKAEAEEHCTTRDGKKTDFHSAREKAYDAWQDGRLEYGSVTADHLRRLISPPSTEVNYGSDEYTLADLVAAHQVIRGYDAPARSGHKGRSRKIRVEMQRRVDPEGKINTHPLSAEEVIRSAPKQLRDWLQGVRTMDLEAAIEQAAAGLHDGQTPDSDTENDGDRPELPEGWKWEELPNGLPKAVGPNDEKSSAQYDWEAVAARARATYAENHRPEEVEALLEKCSNGDARMEDLVLAHEYMMISDRKYETLRDAFDRTDEEWATLSKCWEKYSYVQHSPSDLLSKAIRHERGEMEGQHTQWDAELLEEHVGSALEKSVYYSEQPDTRESADESYDSDRDRTKASASDGGSDAGAREKGDTDTSRDDAREKSTDGTSQGHQTKSERPSGTAEGEQPAVSEEVSGDGAPPSDSNTERSAHLLMVIDAVEADGHDWKLQSLDEGYYQGTVQNGGKSHIAEGATPAEALQSAWHSAQDVPADEIGSVDPSDVDQLLSADGTEMWDDQAAEEASIASLLVAHRVAGQRQETWRTTLIAEAVEERAGRVTGGDVPDDVLEEVQAEVERRLEPAEA
jgi:ParB family chromosome partitioning protein